MYLSHEKIIIKHIVLRTLKQKSHFHRPICPVREHMGWVRNVVLRNIYLGLEKSQGAGISGEGPHGQVRE
jgi:hypothetical protein